jgi:FtsH-binding integral membrane protein
MPKTSTQTLLSLLVATTCAISLSVVLAKSGPSAAVAVLSTVITALSLQLAFMRRDLSALKEQTQDKKNS